MLLCTKYDSLRVFRRKEVATMATSNDDLRACLHESGGLQVGEVTRLGGVEK